MYFAWVCETRRIIWANPAYFALCLVCLQNTSIKSSPDTGDLNVRAGLHSGPVTAGVLRGDRARFQLFGDTVNTGAEAGLLISHWPNIIF